jgi:general secretion pathway protein L
MSHDVVGLDLGSSEVRAIVVRMSLRGREVVKIESEPVNLKEDGRSDWDETLLAAGRLVKRLDLSGETVHTAIPGELASVRRLELPLSASRRLEQVLKFELDEMLPFDIDDAVFDFVEINRNDEAISILSATALSDKVAGVIEGLSGQEIAPREIGVANLSYETAKPRGKENLEETCAIVDIGHLRTNIAVIDMNAPTIRTVLRGGRDLTLKLAQAGGVDFDKAEALKRQHGLQGKVGEALEEAIRPLLREIQQTLKGHLASGGKRVDRVLLCGGGGLVAGLDRYLADGIGTPVERYEPVLGHAESGREGFHPSAYALAFSLALREERSRSKRIDLRRGDLAFKGDYEFLKKRIGWMAACAIAVLLSWIFASYAEYQVLAEKVAAQKASLADNTKRLFGKPMLDYEQIVEKFTGEKVEEAPIPKKDAFDIVLELSRRIPYSVVHDLDYLEIKPKRITLRGIVDAELKSGTSSGGGVGDRKPDAGEELSPTDLIKQKLDEFKECFTAIRVTKVTSVDQRRRYQMDIDTKCP